MIPETVVYKIYTLLMFLCCAGSQDQSDVKDSSYILSPMEQHRRREFPAKTNIETLRMSVMKDSSCAGSESIPENQLFLLGTASPLILKIVTKHRKGSFGTGAVDTLELRSEQLMLSMLLPMLRSDSVVLNLGCDNPDLIKQLCEACRMMVWTPLGLCRPQLCLENLKVSDSFDSFNKFDTLGLFDDMDKRPCFTTNPKTQAIDVLIACFMSKNENKGS